MKVMTSTSESPWFYMKSDTSRRIDIATNYDFFWITDNKNRYGLLIKFKFDLSAFEVPTKIKGISIVTISGDESGKLYLILTNNNDWEIFLAVCNDLVLLASKCLDEFGMIPVISQRIRRWQKFLSENNTTSMAETLQMGLIAELYCMLDSLIPAFGHREAILAWVGPDADRKDFSFADFFIEVKSYISSKGQTVKISSIQQLDNEIKPVFLLAYGLTRTESGLSIVDLINAIDTIIPEDDDTAKETFESKLAAYGYIKDLTKPPFYLYSFDMDKSYLVSDGFPRISACNVDNRILSVQYTVDLAKCASFETSLSNIIG